MYREKISQRPAKFCYLSLPVPLWHQSAVAKRVHFRSFVERLGRGSAWHPEVAPTGPVVILVSLPDQLLYVYRNGVRIGRSTVSTGKPGKSTPTGVFTVLQKKVRHESSIYKGAQMPHMQRLTWTGVAMHAGNYAPLITQRLSWHPPRASLKRISVEDCWGESLR
jgi:hypothetical protein